MVGPLRDQLYRLGLGGQSFAGGGKSQLERRVVGIDTGADGVPGQFENVVDQSGVDADVDQGDLIGGWPPW